MKDLLARIDSLERLVRRVNAVEKWCDRHQFEGHG
jgi:hypothetical protein